MTCSPNEHGDSRRQISRRVDYFRMTHQSPKMSVGKIMKDKAAPPAPTCKLPKVAAPSPSPHQRHDPAHFHFVTHESVWHIFPSKDLNCHVSHSRRHLQLQDRTKKRLLKKRKKKVVQSGKLWVTQDNKSQWWWNVSIPTTLNFENLSLKIQSLSSR